MVNCLKLLLIAIDLEALSELTLGAEHPSVTAWFAVILDRAIGRHQFRAVYCFALLGAQRQLFDGIG